MASPLKEAALRDAKEFLVGEIADQARDAGIMPNPDIHAAFVDPIIRKVEVDAEDDARKGVSLDAPAAPRPDCPERTRLPDDASWIEEEVAGTATFDPTTGDFALDNPPPPEPHEPFQLAVRRERFRFLRTLPAWRHRIEQVLFSKKTRERKVVLYERIYKDSIRAFGDPMKPKEKKIIVGGAAR